MDIVFLVGRILFALLFIASGIQAHFVGYRQGVEYARAYGSPLPEVGVPLTGAMIVVGGLMVGFGILADVGAILIAAFLVLITPIMHAFWKEEDEQMRAIQTAMFMKNFGLLGGAVVIFYLYNQLQGDAGLSLTDPLFNRDF